MTNILRIDASMRTEGSSSRALADDLIKALNRSNNAKVVSRDLARGIDFIDQNWIGANFTDPGQRSTDQSQALADSDRLVEELRTMDVLVIATPIYNFQVPAALKAWIDQVFRAKETFQYEENGPKGLIEGKKAYVILTSGGTAMNSELDFVSPWLTFALGFIGIQDVEYIDATGQMMDAEKLNKAQLSIQAKTA